LRSMDRRGIRFLHAYENRRHLDPRCNLTQLR
jgi:hypothetical protein